MLNETMQRIVFDLPKSTVEELNTLMKITGQTRRSELLRDALKLYQYLAEQREKGYEVLLRKRDIDNEPLEKILVNF